MFKNLKRRMSSHRNEEELLRRAMGQLYLNQAAREMLSQRLRGRDISDMSEAQIYALVREVINDMRRMGYAT
jgi:hypothetical protein